MIDNNTEEVVSDLKDIIEKLFAVFSQYKIKANLGKYYMFSSTTE